MEDKIKEIGQTLIARSKSTVFGSIILSWALINWDSTLVLFFSSKVIEAKINYITQIPTLNLIVYPIISGLAIALLSPLISFLPWIIQHNIDEKKALKRKEIIKKEDALSYIARIEEQENELHNTKIENSEKLTKAKSQIRKEYDESTKRLQDKFEDMGNQLNKEKIKKQEIISNLKNEHENEINNLKIEHMQEIDAISNSIKRSRSSEEFHQLRKSKYEVYKQLKFINSLLLNSEIEPEAIINSIHDISLNVFGTTNDISETTADTYKFLNSFENNSNTIKLSSFLAQGYSEDFYQFLYQIGLVTERHNSDDTIFLTEIGTTLSSLINRSDN